LRYIDLAARIVSHDDHGETRRDAMLGFHPLDMTRDAAP
jgi:hypothetical protein